MKNFKTVFNDLAEKIVTGCKSLFTTKTVSAADRKKQKLRYTAASGDNKGASRTRSSSAARQSKKLFPFDFSQAAAFVTKHYKYFAAGAAIAVAVPIITSVSISNAQVAVISEINVSTNTSAEVQDDQSDLFEGIVSEYAPDTASSAESDSVAVMTIDEESSAGSSAEASSDEQTTEESSEPEEPVYTPYSEGMEADFVAQIQSRLMDLGYMEHDEPTTLYGPITTQAIGYFQRKNGLAQDGIAGEATQQLLFSGEAKLYTVSEGDSGADVESIQERLAELGYSVSSTGYYGSDTTKAVAYFQRMCGLTDDGCVGENTREALYAADAPTSLEYGKKQSSGSGSSSSSSNKGSSSGSSSGGSSGGGKTSTTVIADPGSVESFITVAESMAGVPYVKGGKSTSGVDCSGLVYVALKNSGNSIGYMTSGGWAGSGYPTVYSMSELQRGDIVCFNGHVGIYLGGDSMIDASSSQGCVRYCSSISSSNYWTRNFICGKRPL